MISGKGGFTAKKSCPVSERKSRKEKRRKRKKEIEHPYRFKNRQTRDRKILKDAFRLNAANEIVLVKKGGGVGRWVKKESDSQRRSKRRE